MDFSTQIEGFNSQYNLNAIDDYNKYLKGNASFNFEPESDKFAEALDAATKKIHVKPMNAPDGFGNFFDNISASFSNSLNAINNTKLEADRMQEDIAMGGPTSIHDAMIAAEKADLSMKMAVQVRNRILDAYTQITNMAL